MMRRIMMLVTVSLAMAVMMAVTAGSAAALGGGPEIWPEGCPGIFPVKEVPAEHGAAYADNCNAVEGRGFLLL